MTQSTLTHTSVIVVVSIVNMSDSESSSSELRYESGDTSSKQAMNTAIFDRIIGLFRLFQNGFYRTYRRLLVQKHFGSYVYTVSEYV